MGKSPFTIQSTAALKDLKKSADNLRTIIQERRVGQAVELQVFENINQSFLTEIADYLETFRCRDELTDKLINGLKGILSYTVNNNAKLAEYSECISRLFLHIRVSLIQLQTAADIEYTKQIQQSRNAVEVNRIEEFLKYKSASVINTTEVLSPIEKMLENVGIKINSLKEGKITSEELCESAVYFRINAKTQCKLRGLDDTKLEMIDTMYSLMVNYLHSRITDLSIYKSNCKAFLQTLDIEFQKLNAISNQRIISGLFANTAMDTDSSAVSKTMGRNL